MFIDKEKIEKKILRKYIYNKYITYIYIYTYVYASTQRTTNLFSLDKINI